MPFNCLDCSSPSGRWGRHAVPPHPTGFYRPLWQAMDAAGCVRLYPSYASDCATPRGTKQRGDHWTPYTLVDVLVAMNNGNGIATHSFPVNTKGLSIFNAAVALAVASPDATARGWCTIVDRSHSPYIIGFFWKYGPPFTFYDLRDMSSFVFSAPPAGLGPVVGDSQLLAGTDVYGNPWLNPI